MTCDVCGKDIPRGQRYKGDKYANQHFCSEDCYKRFCTIKLSPRALINFKPEKGTDRREFTDYIQEWTNDMVNWQWVMKQAKDIQEEYELDWHEMYLICKYARVYEGVEWDFQYGLGQIFPRYIQPCRDFREAIKMAKTTELPEETIVVVKRKQPYRKEVEW